MGVISDRFKTVTGAALIAIGLSTTGYGFTVAGVEFDNFLLFDIGPNSDAQISSTGDIYLITPPALPAEAGVPRGAPASAGRARLADISRMRPIGSAPVKCR